MATIDEILAEMPEVSATGATDEVLVIDANTRQIDIPGVELIFGVESDTHAERKYFLAPRYVGHGLDLSGCFIRVNFQNANGEIDSYLVEDVAVTKDGREVTFSWELSRKVTEYRGLVKFVVCAIVPGSGSIYPEWHTTQASGVVLEGLEPDTSKVEAETADVVAQLIAMVEAQTAEVESVGKEWVAAVKDEGATQVEAVQTASADAQAVAVAEIEAKGVNTRESIPDDYTALSEAVDALNRNRGAAIVCEAAGETVMVNDASDLPMQGLRVFGKTTQATTTGAQILELPDSSKVDRGLTVVVTDGVCTVSGTAAPLDGSMFECTLLGSYNRTDVLFTLQPGTYTLTDCSIVSYDGVNRVKHYLGTTFTLTEAFDVTWVATRAYKTGEAVKEVTYPMINAGSVALPWEPYSGGKPSPSPEYPQELVSLEPKVEVYGSNLANTRSIENGANTSATASEDGYTITCIGGADKPYTSSPIYLPMDILRGKTVILKADSITNSQDSSGKGGNVQLNIMDSDKMRYVAISPNNLMAVTTIPKDVTRVDLNIYTNNSATMFEAANTTVVKGLRLMIVDGEWEAYRQPQTLELTHTLPGIPVTSDGNYTDPDGQEWICDEVDLERGVYVQRIKRLALNGSEPWTTNNGSVYYLSFQDMHRGGGTSGVYLNGFMFNRYPHAKTWEDIATTDGVACVYWHNSWEHGRIAIHEASCSTTDEWKSYLAENSVECMYTLATPIETPLSEPEIAAYRALHSNYPNTTVLNDSGAYMVVKYAADTKLYIDNKIAALTA